MNGPIYTALDKAARRNARFEPSLLLAPEFEPILFSEAVSSLATADADRSVRASIAFNAVLAIVQRMDDRRQQISEAVLGLGPYGGMSPSFRIQKLRQAYGWTDHNYSRDRPQILRHIELQLGLASTTNIRRLATEGSARPNEVADLLQGQAGAFTIMATVMHEITPDQVSFATVADSPYLQPPLSTYWQRAHAECMSTVQYILDTKYRDVHATDPASVLRALDGFVDASPFSADERRTLRASLFGVAQGPLERAQLDAMIRQAWNRFILTNLRSLRGKFGDLAAAAARVLGAIADPAEREALTDFVEETFGKAKVERAVRMLMPKNACHDIEQISSYVSDDLRTMIGFWVK
jgi:hypothetical protein